MKKTALFSLVLFLAILSGFARPFDIKGIVYNDINKNGHFDSHDKAIPGVYVSNQNSFVVTGADGKYAISSIPGSFLYVVKPSGYEFARDRFNMPVFWYYIQKEEINEVDVNFALYKTEEKTCFKALILGDPQMRTTLQLGYFRDEIVNDLMFYENESDFLMVLGDIADDSLSIYPHFKNLMSVLTMNKYMVFGNHDMDVRAIGSRHQAETFSKYFGPDFYSFNHGHVHFVVLNNIEYEGWDFKNNKAGNYFGGLAGIQFEWLEKDLALVPDSQLIVLSAHIPFHENYFDKKQLNKLFGILKNKKKILALSGHLHARERYFMDSTSYWHGGKFEYINVGATCGSWWTGPKNENGIPEATCMDGSPNGFYVFTFENNGYSFDFHEAGKGVGNEMRISYPASRIKVEDLEKNEIVVNVFAGNSATQVNYSIDQLPETKMLPFKGKDPFILRTKELRVNDDNWSPGVGQSSHLWKAVFPGNLAKGVHRLRAVVQRDGKVFSKEMIFEVY